MIDQRTGEIRPGRPEDYISKASPIEWTGIDTPAPLWEQFLLEIFQEDSMLIAYLGRLLGYAITGQIREHIIVIFNGSGEMGNPL